MRVAVIGINYKSSELALREILSKACEQCFGTASEIAARFSCILLNTCNRTEIYFSAEDVANAHTALLTVLRRVVKLDFEHHLYSYFGSECFAHLAKVTAGLDSLIVAESEIQGQVKGAYQHAALHRHLPSCLHFMFQKCLKIAKQARSNFSFSQPPGCTRATLEGTLFYMSALIAESPFSVLFVGNSEINRKILSFFRRKGVENMALCTRSIKAAQALFPDKNGFTPKLTLEVVGWDHLPLWPRYDVVVVGTMHSDYLIYPEQMGSIYDGRSRLVFDLSVPRTVDPRLGRHPSLSLFNIEEIGQIIEKRKKDHLLEIKDGSDGIHQAVHRQIALFNHKQHPLLQYV